MAWMAAQPVGLAWLYWHGQAPAPAPAAPSEQREPGHQRTAARPHTAGPQRLAQSSTALAGLAAQPEGPAWLTGPGPAPAPAQCGQHCHRHHRPAAPACDAIRPACVTGASRAVCARWPPRPTKQGPCTTSPYGPSPCSASNEWTDTAQKASSQLAPSPLLTARTGHKLPHPVEPPAAHQRVRTTAAPPGPQHGHRSQRKDGHHSHQLPPQNGQRTGYHCPCVRPRPSGVSERRRATARPRKTH